MDKALRSLLQCLGPTEAILRARPEVSSERDPRRATRTGDSGCGGAGGGTDGAGDASARPCLTAGELEVRRCSSCKRQPPLAEGVIENPAGTERSCDRDTETDNTSNGTGSAPVAGALPAARASEGIAVAVVPGCGGGGGDATAASERCCAAEAGPGQRSKQQARHEDNSGVRDDASAQQLGNIHVATTDPVQQVTILQDSHNGID